MDLFNKFIIIIKEELKVFGCNDFSGFDNEEVLAFYLNLKTKMIEPNRFILKESNELIDQIPSLNKKTSRAYKEIKRRLRDGMDVNPFLSKQAIDPKYQDELLLDWKIHHFHLNNRNIGTYFNERADYLLMAIFKGNTAHLISIEPHKDIFAKIEYLKIIKDSWPEVIKPFGVKGSVSHNITSSTIKKLRKHQINTSYQIDDMVYLTIGGGVTSSGAGAIHVQDSTRWHDFIDFLEKKYKKNRNTLLEYMHNETGNIFVDFKLNFIFSEGCLLLVEEKSRLILETLDFSKINFFSALQPLVKVNNSTS